MQYQIELDREAVKYLACLPEKQRRQIAGKIESLRQNPLPQGYKKLKENLYRIRSGDYRIVYTVLEKRILILILAIGNRKDIYRHLSNF